MCSPGSRSARDDNHCPPWSVSSPTLYKGERGLDHPNRRLRRCAPMRGGKRNRASQAVQSGDGRGKSARRVGSRRHPGPRPSFTSHRSTPHRASARPPNPTIPGRSRRHAAASVDFDARPCLRFLASCLLPKTPPNRPRRRPRDRRRSLARKDRLSWNHQPPAERTRPSMRSRAPTASTPRWWWRVPAAVLEPSEIEPVRPPSGLRRRRPSQVRRVLARGKVQSARVAMDRPPTSRSRPGPGQPRPARIGCGWRRRARIAPGAPRSSGIRDSLESAIRARTQIARQAMS